MVEIYFNAQSDNGTLTSSEFLWANGVEAKDADTTNRSCSSGVVAELHAKHTPRKRPQGAAAAAKLDDTSGLR
jgi:hypothetical protein